MMNIIVENSKDRIVIRRSATMYFVGFAIFAAILACNLSGSLEATQTPTVVASATSPVCGDGMCTAPEDANNCPADCAPTATFTQETQDATVKMTSDVHVRFGPSLNCAVLGNYPKDTETQALAKSPDGMWWQVPFGNNVGWLSMSYTTPVTDISKVPELPGPYCEPPTNTPIPPTETPVPPTLTSTPAAVCGNGVVETGEECDGANTCGGLLLFCNTSCQCKTLSIVTIVPAAVCGNGVVESGEACDGPGTCGSNFMICTSSCTCKFPVIQQP